MNQMHNLNSQESLTTIHLTDQEIISRVLTGEKELYSILVKKYNQRLYRVCMSIIDNDAEAEDVMQVAYVRAYENLAKFEFRSSFSTWVTRILINESLLRVKNKKKSFQMHVNIAARDKLSADSMTPLKKTMNGELKQVLETAIRQLPEKYRTVFVMREIEDLDVSETKECLGISEVNVKVRLSRAKALLRDFISSVYNKDELLHFHLSRCDRITEAVMSRIR
jgi:RNA polymerase sigma-70 factor (ECF subfamily)